jgi:proline iminopeptidase
VVVYDQLGTGRSERPADTTLWALPRFVAEIDSIRARLGLRADTLVATLPKPARRAIAAADSTARYDAPEFVAAVDSFNARYNQRVQRARYPECEGVKGSDAVYRYMWGPSEFRSTGTLRAYDRTARLGELRLPVLLVGGEYDEARPSTLGDFQRRIPGAELVVVPGAAHRMLVDAPAPTLAAIRDFLGRRGIP